MDAEGVLEVDRFPDVGRDAPRPELDPGATWCRVEGERRAPSSEGDVRDLSLALRFFLRKLEGSSRERVGDDDWPSDSSGGCDDAMAESQLGDVEDCTGVPFALPSFACLASRSCSLSFALAEGLV